MSPVAQNMKTRVDALGTAENESRRTKHENGTRRPWYGPKSGLGAENKKTLWDALGTAENESRGGGNMKTGPDALGTLKTSPGVQNLKTGPVASGTAEN
jgi:hypothetical protein